MANVRVTGVYSGRIEVAAGPRLDIVNLEGKQVCDFTDLELVTHAPG